MDEHTIVPPAVERKVEGQVHHVAHVPVPVDEFEFFGALRPRLEEPRIGRDGVSRLVGGGTRNTRAQQDECRGDRDRSR